MVQTKENSWVFGLLGYMNEMKRNKANIIACFIVIILVGVFVLRFFVGSKQMYLPFSVESVDYVTVTHKQDADWVGDKNAVLSVKVSDEDEIKQIYDIVRGMKLERGDGRGFIGYSSTMIVSFHVWPCFVYSVYESNCQSPSVVWKIGMPNIFWFDGKWTCSYDGSSLYDICDLYEDVL